MIVNSSAGNKFDKYVAQQSDIVGPMAAYDQKGLVGSRMLEGSKGS